MVVLAARDWIHVGLYSGMQNGRIVHFHECRSCCFVGSVGNSGCQEGTYHGELQITVCRRQLTTGLLQPTFRLPSYWTYCRTILPLPPLLLGSLQGPHLLWTWRFLHVARFPGDSSRKRAASKFSGYVTLKV